MEALLKRLGLAVRAEILVGAALAGLVAGWWSGVPALGLALGLGAALLAQQILAQRQDLTAEHDRDQVRRIIETAAPLARSGTPLETALIRAAQAEGGGGGQALAASLAAAAAGRAGSPDGLRLYPYSELIFQLWKIHRQQGGDPAPFLTAYHIALGMSEGLAKKRQLALMQIRWQANVITAFFFIVLGFSAVHAGVFVSALLESPEGRWMTALSASLVIWGRVALNLLARTMV